MTLPENRFHAIEIADAIIELIRTNFTPAAPTGLGLKKVHYGGIENLPYPRLSTDILPVVLMKPVTSDNSFGDPVTKITEDHTFRLLYIMAFQDGEEFARNKWINFRRILNKVQDYFLLRDPVTRTPIVTLSDGFGVYSGIVKRIDYEPPEDDAVFADNKNICAIAADLMYRESGRHTER